jgi:bacillithiol system protein YtxJ
MNWIELKSAAQVAEIRERSKATPQVIFKHSTRCSISGMAKNRLDKSNKPDNVDFYYLDLISYRSISNQVSEEYNIDHESPQVLVIKDGECVYDVSHSAIRMEDIMAEV